MSTQWDQSATGAQVLISIPSLTDPALAPPGKHTLHAYLPATEPWDKWAGRNPRYYDIMRPWGPKAAADCDMFACRRGAGHARVRAEEAGAIGVAVPGC